MDQKLIVTNIEVLGEFSRFEPDERGGHSVEDDGGNLMRFGGAYRLLRNGRDHEMKQIFFAFKLISVGAEDASEVVRF
jgi:hypothetical protein